MADTGGMDPISGALLGKFGASIAPIYFTFLVGVGYCLLDILKLDFVPAISVLIQYVALPGLLFLRLAGTPTDQLDPKLMGADALSKAVPLVVMLVWWRFFSKFGKVESMEWTITFFMLSTLPNTVLIGDQILSPMFTDSVENQTTTIIFAQSLYWYNCVILMMEIREMFIEDEQKDVIAGADLADKLAEIEKQKKISIVEDMEKSMPSWEMGNPSVREANGPSINKSRPSWEVGRTTWSKSPYDAEMNDYSVGSTPPLTPRSFTTPSRSMTPNWMTPNGTMTPSSVTPSHLDRDPTNNSMTPTRIMTPTRFTPSHLDRDYTSHPMNPSKLNPDHSNPSMATNKLNHSLTFTTLLKSFEREYDPEKVQTTVDSSRPSTVSLIGRTLLRVLKRMLQVPLFYGSSLGFVWSINKSRVPSFMANSFGMCAELTIALSMILLGQVCVKSYYGEKGWIGCGWKLLFAGFFARFVFAPIVMWFSTMPFSIKGTLLKYAILQVIVPQGSMSFALAQIYGCKITVISTAIYIQMIVFVPVILAYNAVLQKL